MVKRGWVVAFCFVVGGCGGDSRDGVTDVADGDAVESFDGVDADAVDAVDAESDAVDAVDAESDAVDAVDAESDAVDAVDAAPDGEVSETPAARVLELAQGTALHSVAITPDGSRAYLGLLLGERRGRDIVLVIDPSRASDVDSAIVARAVVGMGALPPGRRDSVSALALDPVRRRLYGALSPLDASGFSVSDPVDDLVAWELDAQWHPIDPPRVMDSGQPYHSIGSLAVSPDRRWLYASGFGEAGVRLVPLDADGWPTTPAEAFLFGGSGKSWSRPIGDHLWAGAYPGQLEAVPLAADGRPVHPDPAAPPPAICWDRCDLAEGYLEPLLVGDTLVRRSPAPYPYDTLAESSRDPLEVRPLSLEGSRTFLPDTRATAIATDGTHLVWARETTFVDAVSGLDVPDGADIVRAELDGDRLGPVEVLAPAPGRYVSWLVAPASGPVLALAETRPIALGRAYPSALTLTVDVLDAVDADGQAIADPATALADLYMMSIGSSWPVTPLLTPGVPFPLDELLRERDGAVLVSLGSYQPLDRLHVAVRVDDGPTNLRTFDLDVVGSEVLFFLPGGRVHPDRRVALLESMDERAEKYRDSARAAAPDGTPRPRAFPVSCFHVLGGQGSRRQLEAEVEAVARLGCNVVTAYWWGRLPAADVRAVLDRWGITRVTGAVYTPPSYFAHDLDALGDEALATWVDDTLGADLATAGRSWDEVANVQIADEPGWYYPFESDHVAAEPALLARFQGWVEALGEPAEAYGVTTFDELFPTTGEARGTLEGNRRFAATMRFFADQAAAGFKRTREAIEARAGRDVFASSNFNNANLWSLPTPGTAYANNWDAGERSGFGSLDWLAYARTSAANPWTEDWFLDRAAVDWSLLGDYLRRMAELGGRPFGSYLIGGMMGYVPHGPSLKLFALLGRGLKLVDLWTFGPEPLFPGNCWSENHAAYPGIAQAFTRLAAIEDDVLPATPDRGAVALLAHHASFLWDPTYEGHRTYLYESAFAAPALAAANLDVDPLDDVDLAADALAARGHAALIVTGPNVAEAAQQAIETWVEGGGALVLLPSAGVADELARPTARFDRLAGVRQRPDERPYGNPWGYGENPVLSAELTPTALGVAAGLAPIRIVGPVQPLHVSGGAVWATDASGQALLVVHSVGAGRVITFGFWPGLELLQSRLDKTYTRLEPLGDPGLRAYATLGPRLAGVAKRATVDHDGVEALVLESDRSLVVILLDWSGAGVPSLTVTVRDEGSRSRARNLRGDTLAVTRRGDALTVVVPLDGVDALVFE